MSRTATTLAVLLLDATVLAGTARAGEPPSPGVAATFGNTVISTYPDGRTQKIWIQPDGAWTGVSRKGVPLVGRWTVRDGKVCLRQSRPPTLPLSFCQALPADMSKDMETRDVVGTPIRLHLVRGVTNGPGG